VIERAAVTKFAFSGLHEVFAGFGLVVGVDGAEHGLTEAGGEGVIGVSELGRAMSKLAVVHEWALSAADEVFAHLGLELLLELVELGIAASVEVFVVCLMGQVSVHFTRRVVEVLFRLAVGAQLSAVGLLFLRPELANIFGKL